MTASYEIEKLGSSQQLQELRESWEGLTGRISDCSFFLSWAWISTWWSNLRDDQELWLLTARDNGGRLAGIAPLMLSRRRFGPTVLRCLSFIGSGIAAPVHLDLLAAPEEAEEIAVAFMQYLNFQNRQWDILDLIALREVSPLKTRIATAGGRWLEREPMRCSFARLPDSWEVFQTKQMNSKLRKTIRYYERRLEKDFPGLVDTRMVTSQSELDQALRFLIMNSRRVFSRAEVASSFASEEFCKFYREMALMAFRQGFIRFYQLVVDGRIIAEQQCFCFKDIFYGYQTAYDPDWGKYSPGQQLLARVFRGAIEEKAREVDMSHGETEYKARWAGEERQDCHLIYARNSLGRLWLLRILIFDRLLEIARRLVPRGARRKMGRFLGIGSA